MVMVMAMTKSIRGDGGDAIIQPLRQALLMPAQLAPPTQEQQAPAMATPPLVPTAVILALQNLLAGITHRTQQALPKRRPVATVAVENIVQPGIVAVKGRVNPMTRLSLDQKANPRTPKVLAAVLAAHRVAENHLCLNRSKVA